MCIYMYICIYVCLYVCIYMHVHVYYVCICVCIYGFYVWMYIFRHWVHKRACMSIHILFWLYCISCTYRKSKKKVQKKISLEKANILSISIYFFMRQGYFPFAYIFQTGYILLSIIKIFLSDHLILISIYVFWN